jgi:hypothetical protein
MCGTREGLDRIKKLEKNAGVIGGIMRGSGNINISNRI